MKNTGQTYLDKYDEAAKQLYAEAYAGNHKMIPALRAKLKQAEKEALQAIKRMKSDE